MSVKQRPFKLVLTLELSPLPELQVDEIEAGRVPMLRVKMAKRGRDHCYSDALANVHELVAEIECGFRDESGAFEWLEMRASPSGSATLYSLKQGAPEADVKALFRQEHWPKPEREDEDFDHEFDLDVASSKFVFHTDSNGHLCIRESGAWAKMILVAPGQTPLALPLGVVGHSEGDWVWFARSDPVGLWARLRARFLFILP